MSTNPQSGSTSDFYDIRGERLLQSSENIFATRKKNILALGPLKYLEGSLPPPKHPGQSRLLDLCSGTGIHSVYPALQDYRVTGVDISPKSVEAAKKLAQQNGIESKCEFIVGDVIRWLRESTEKFEVIMIAGSLYYLDLDTVMPLISERLESGGTFLAVETNGDNFLMNTFRRLRNRKSGHRDERTLSHLLRSPDFTKMKSLFSVSNVTYFDFLSLFSVPFRKAPALARSIHALLRPIDYVLLNFLGLRAFAFKVFFRAQKS